MAAINLDEFEGLAKARLSQMAYDYYAGGAEDELTLTDNRRAWQRIKLRPRMLVDVSRIDTTTTVLGQPVAFPVLAAPCAFHKLAHPDGECAVARATAAAGTIQIVSTTSSTPLEEVAAVPGPRWFQLYHYRDRAITRSLVERAEAAGYLALCLTVDTPLLGRRERDQRNGFALPDGVVFANLIPYAVDLSRSPDTGSILERYATAQTDGSLTWEVVGWLRSLTRLPIVVKGLLTAEDARLALEHGVDGIVVSNHGGRQLDSAIPTAEALPEIVEAVGGKVEVLVDGGIRRGTDVLKALALGARAVLVGRPYLWGLAADGETGVRAVFRLLHAELTMAMAQSGRPTIAALDTTLLARNLTD